MISIASALIILMDYPGLVSFIGISLPLLESFQLQMGFSFPFLRANDYVLLYLLLELVVFYSLVHKGYILKVSVQLVPK